MKKGLIFVSVLLALSLALNVFQHLNDKKHRRCYPKYTGLLQDDSLFIDRTVSIYDSFVRLKVPGDMPIEEAYLRFFVERRDSLEHAGDKGIFYPDSTFVYAWTYDLIGGKMFTSFLGVNYYSPNDYSSGLSYPATWNFQIHPRLIKFGESLGSDFWNEVMDGTEAAGALGISHHNPVIWSTEKINFSSRNERFLTAIGFMGDCLTNRSFIIETDLHKSDSLNALWKIELKKRRAQSSE